MRNFVLFAATVAALFLAAPAAFADNNCLGFSCDQENNTTNNVDNSVGPVVTDNFSPSATAAGGYSDAHAVGSAALYESGNSNVGPVGNNSGNSENRNRNLNDSTFGNAAALSGAGVFDSGNSRSNSDSNARVGDISNRAQGGDGGSARATQGQIGIQGQLGILDNENALDNSNNTNTSTATSTRQGQDQDQTAVGNVDSHDSVSVEGDDVVYEAPDIPVNSAAPVFAGACSQGVSVQTQSFGGSAGTTNPVCDYVAVAGGFIAGGDRDQAMRVLGKAEKAADFRYRFSQVRSFLTLGLL